MKRLFWAFTILSFTLISCDKCKDVTCENGGTCNEGVCECLEGFSGEECEIEDKCITSEVDCKNGGECENGECECPDWYTGDECEFRVLSDHTGNYLGSYSCSWEDPYIFKLETVTAPDRMLIKDLSTWSIDRKFEAKFTTPSNFNVPEQNVAGYNNETLKAEGSGSITSAGLSMTLTFTNVTAGTSTEECTYLGEK